MALAAIGCRPQVVLLARAEVNRQVMHRSNEIGDRVEWRSLSGATAGAMQPLAHDIRLGYSALSRFCFDVRHERLRQSYVQRSHPRSVLQVCQLCNTLATRSREGSVARMAGQSR